MFGEQEIAMIKEARPGRAVEDASANDSPVGAFHLVAHERAGGRLGGVKIVSVIEIQGLQVRAKRPPYGKNKARCRTD